MNSSLSSLAYPRISRGIFYRDREVDLSAQIVIVVGPNNSGKTQFLRDVEAFTQGDSQEKLILQSAAFGYSRSIDDIVDWLEKHASRTTVQTYVYDHGEIRTRVFQHDTQGWGVSEHEIRRSYNNQEYLHWFASQAQMLSAETRLSLTNFALSSDVTQSPPSTLEKFALLDEVRPKLSDATLEAFGFITTVWPTGGGYRLVRGEAINTPERWGAYQEEMKALPKIDEQGDGVRSFTGIMVELLTADHNIVLLDEPEAFLHPPQARMLGRQIGRLRSSERQVFVATHSSDLLDGLLNECAGKDVTIVRLTRTGDETSAFQIPPSDLEDWTQDTLLRHARLMEGLFFDGTILCESDRDATYYEATYDFIADTLSPKLDLNFTHALGGKDRIAAAISSLRKAGVPCASIVDIDLLRNVSDVIKFIRAHGGEPDSLGVIDKLNVINKAVLANSNSPLRDTVKSQLLPIIQSDDKYLSTNEVTSLSRLGNTKTGWAHVKAAGVSHFRGPVHQQLREVLATLAEIGIFVLSVGELESFHREISPTNKAEWISKVLRNKMYENCAEGKELMMSVHQYLFSAIGNRANR